MIVIGADTHKQTHALAAVDDGTGRVRGTRQISADEAGHLVAVRWARELDPERVWAIEDCRHVSGRLEQALIAAGERVVRVAPKMMGATRRGERDPGKSDELDALAVARAVVKDGVERFPADYLDQRAMEIRLLCDHRQDLVAERTRAQNRLRWHLLELCPAPIGFTSVRCALAATRRGSTVMRKWGPPLAAAIIGIIVGVAIGTGSSSPAKTVTLASPPPAAETVTVAATVNCAPGTHLTDKFCYANESQTVTTTAAAQGPAAGSTTRFSGNGGKRLGTIHVTRGATFVWTNDGGIFQVFDADAAIPVNSTSASGTSDLPTGTYKDVQVNAVGNWTIKIVPK
jgi:hypothetical protein